MSVEKVALDFITVYKRYKERRFSERKNEGGHSSEKKRRKNTSDQEEHTS